MRVDVYQSRREREAGEVDRLAGLGPVQVAHRLDAAVRDEHVAHERLGSGAVVDRAAREKRRGHCYFRPSTFLNFWRTPVLAR